MSLRAESSVAGSCSLRRRRGGDIAALTEVLRSVHELRGYPAALPRDLASWFAGPRETMSWVAVSGDGSPVGHVSAALAVGDRAEAVWTGALSLPPERLLVVKRLFVEPSREGEGLGRCLLETAVAAAHGEGLWPVLDVDATSPRANRLYVRAGFRLVGTLQLSWPGVERFSANCYVGPRPAAGAPAEG